MAAGLERECHPEAVVVVVAAQDTGKHRIVAPRRDLSARDGLELSILGSAGLEDGHPVVRNDAGPFARIDLDHHGDLSGRQSRLHSPLRFRVKPVGELLQANGRPHHVGRDPRRGELVVVGALGLEQAEIPGAADAPGLIHRPPDRFGLSGRPTQVGRVRRRAAGLPERDRDDARERARHRTLRRVIVTSSLPPSAVFATVIPITS
ncbi:MAG TPA: hypothetical protein VES67_17415 [Vicinamibacterales bacterium]|nr:hypothetical protein [Vicinamibacterales bacterium]